jgi:hypothetical protein
MARNKLLLSNSLLAKGDELMKRLTRFFIATAIALVLAVASISVWAGPRAGTVPTPKDGVGTCGASAVNVGTGTVRLYGSDCQGTVKRIARFGASPAGWQFLLSDVLEVTLVKGALSQVEVCVPFNPAWKGKVANQSISFFYWNATQKAWFAVPTTIKTAENPPVVCGVSASAGSYGLFGK